MNPGVFIVLEGPDGSGKSTQVHLLTQALKSRGYNVVQTREPGGTQFAESLRELLQRHDDLSDTVRLLAQYAARADHVEKVILPALRDGKVVISDRYTLSSVVYQCIAGDAPPMLSKDLATFVVAAAGAVPDLVFVLDAPDDALPRNLAPAEDAMEAKGEEYHAAVREAYRRIVNEDHGHRFESVWAWDDLYAVRDRMLAIIEDVLRQKGSEILRMTGTDGKNGMDGTDGDGKSP